MESVNLKSSICSLYQLKDEKFKTFMLKRCLFKRVRLVRPVVQFFYPDYLFNEKRLIDKIAEAENLKEIQQEVDFYQHKYVVNSVIKDAMRFRISGMRIISIAHKAFTNEIAQQQEATKASPAGN
jgi:hypothetical protein